MGGASPAPICIALIASRCDILPEHSQSSADTNNPYAKPSRKSHANFRKSFSNRCSVPPGSSQQQPISYQGSDSPNLRSCATAPSRTNKDSPIKSARANAIRWTSKLCIGSDRLAAFVDPDKRIVMPECADGTNPDRPQSEIGVCQFMLVSWTPMISKDRPVLRSSTAFRTVPVLLPLSPFTSKRSGKFTLIVSAVSL